MPPLDDTLLALADPTRRAIVHRLRAGEARVTDLAKPFPMSLNAVSKHIRLLERAGLVQRRKVGREQFIAFEPGPLEDARDWFDEQRTFWSARLQAMDHMLQSEDVP